MASEGSGTCDGKCNEFKTSASDSRSPNSDSGYSLVTSRQQPRNSGQAAATEGPIVLVIPRSLEVPTTVVIAPAGDSTTASSSPTFFHKQTERVGGDRGDNERGE